MTAKLIAQNNISKMLADSFSFYYFLFFPPFFFFFFFFLFFKKNLFLLFSSSLVRWPLLSTKYREVPSLLMFLSLCCLLLLFFLSSSLCSSGLLLMVHTSSSTIGSYVGTGIAWGECQWTCLHTYERVRVSEIAFWLAVVFSVISSLWNIFVKHNLF